MNVVFAGIQFGQRTGQIEIQDAGKVIRVEVVLDIQHQTAIDAPCAADLIHAGQRRQCQQLADFCTGRNQFGAQHFGSWHPALLADHGMEVAAHQRVVSHTRR